MNTSLSDYNMQNKLGHVNCGTYNKNETALLFTGDVYTDVEYNPYRLIL